jgi:glycosyltransferase involved in cell wall biosynthesis
MKIAIVTRHFPPDVRTGRETVIANLWQQASDQDDVTLIAGWQNDRRNLPKNCVAIDQSSTSRLRNYLKFFVLSSLYLWRAKPDVILSNAIELGPTLRPVTTIVHDLNFGHADQARGSQGIRHRIIRWRLKRNNRVIAVSHSTAEKLSRLGISSFRINVINNGVDLKRFKVLDGEKLSDQFVVTYPARFVHGKGQHVAIEAIRKISPELWSKLKLVLVGYAQDKEYMISLREGSQDLPIEFHDDVDDIVPYYQSADTIIFPTIMEEGFGYTAAEALSCGKPVIFSDYPAIHEATGGIGVAVPPGDAGALAAEIHNFYVDKSHRDKLSQEGLEYAKANFDWRLVYQKYRQVLEDIAKI